MGTGWRRAFCTSIRGDPEAAEPAVAPDSPAPKTCSRLGFFSSSGGGGGSNPSTPRLRCRTTTPPPPPEVQDGPRLQCRTTRMTPSNSTPSSPRSPSRLANIFKSGLRLSRNSRCGVCMEGVKAGQGRAIFTAECSHAFHFPCIASHVKKTSSLVCPVCSSQWRDPPLVTLHKSLLSSSSSSHRHEPKSMPSTPTKSIEPKPESTPKKAYDDDEPLLSTPHGGPTRFNPIFEAEDEENDDGDDDEIGEFQGFFVNPSSSSSSTSPPVNNAGVEVRMSSEAAVVSISRYHETHIVALRVKAPAAAEAVMLEPGRRAAIDLVTVLDVSATMSGAKLHMLKRAMRLLVASLGPADRLSVVAFSGVAKRLLPLRRMSPAGKRSARQIVDRLACSGGGGGAAAGVSSEALRKRRGSSRTAATATPSRPSSSSRTVRRSVKREHESQPLVFDESQPSNDAVLDKIRAPRDSRPRIGIRGREEQEGGAGGGRVRQVRRGAPQRGRAGRPSPDRVRAGVTGGGGDHRCLLMRRTARARRRWRRVLVGEDRRPVRGGGEGAFGRDEGPQIFLRRRRGDQRLMSIRCCFKDPATQELRHCRDRALVLPTARAVRSSDPKIERLRNLFVATRATAESRRLVERGDSATALHLLSSARSLLMQSSSISADENLRVVETEMAELKWRRQQQSAAQSRRTTETAAAETVGGAEALTPTSAWRAAERLAKVAIMRKSMNRVSDLHGFENARF
ncbi:hypothetical protein QJS10_CPA02g00193 [Acorus calamus]|uniref:RING-type domain-containing protein n=1 Tax=Acorus calamus TaxID=4465 RepID=A0AAV9FHT3_ACOCL|nr:hypothetical protein QJS10_CPA02g00193 [Acorus calamus]